MKKSTSLTLVVIILSLALVSLSGIRAVKAKYAVYIRVDGSVEGTDKIQRDGDVYTLTGDISGGIKVERNFTIIDGTGFTLQGSGEGKGIDLSIYSPSSPRIFNVTVKNLQIKNFGTGIRTVNNNTIIGNYIAGCIAGIEIAGGSNNLIKNNTIANNSNGILIAYSGGNHVITHNNMINNVAPTNNVIIVWLSPKPSVYMNYWSDYNGTDADGDGIGDRPYMYINTDYAKYSDGQPLMEPVPVIPEFPSWTPLLLTLVILAVAVAIYKRRLRRPQTN
ncbi:MAG: right-handed parallel beta-helix repeat-containing protein [Candidatus Bathyarchaeum sp.]|nr:MAG: right-handed parallel beta-helix repeat-containing protein [Candidatus Bathyarchaeum sp.]